MGAWGHKALDNDSALEYVSDVNDRVIKILKKGLKTSTRRRGGQPPDLVSQRAAAEYLIKMYKAGLISNFEISEYFHDAPEQLEKVARAMDDVDNWVSYGSDEKELRNAIRRNQADVQRQIRYLEKILEDERLQTKMESKMDISKEELMRMYESEKAKSAKKKRRKKVR